MQHSSLLLLLTPRRSDSDSRVTLLLDYHSIQQSQISPLPFEDTSNSNLALHPTTDTSVSCRDGRTHTVELELSHLSRHTGLDMATQFTFKDLPEGWHSRNQDKVVEQLKDDSRQLYFQARKSYFWKLISLQPHIPKLTADFLFSPTDIFHALRFYSNPAFCYLLSPPWRYVVEHDPERTAVQMEAGFNVYPHIWLKEAFHIWAVGREQEVSFALKEPFTPLDVSPDDFPHFGAWIGLGVETSNDSRIHPHCKPRKETWPSQFDSIGNYVTSSRIEYNVH